MAFFFIGLLSCLHRVLKTNDVSEQIEYLKNNCLRKLTNYRVRKIVVCERFDNSSWPNFRNERKCSGCTRNSERKSSNSPLGTFNWKGRANNDGKCINLTNRILL